MLSISGHLAILNTTHSRHYDVSLTYTVLWLCMWYTVGWRLRWSCFLRRLSSEWFSATVSPACFQESGTVTLAKILQTLWFPGSAVFHRRMEDFRPRVAVFTALYCYTYAKPLCVSVHPTSRGQCNCGACRHSLIIPLHPTLYHAIRGMYSLLVYSGYDTYNTFRRS